MYVASYITAKRGGVFNRKRGGGTWIKFRIKLDLEPGRTTFRRACPPSFELGPRVIKISAPKFCGNQKFFVGFIWFIAHDRRLPQKYIILFDCWLLIRRVELKIISSWFEAQIFCYLVSKSEYNSIQDRHLDGGVGEGVGCSILVFVVSTEC